MDDAAAAAAAGIGACSIVISLEARRQTGQLPAHVRSNKGPAYIVTVEFIVHCTAS